MTTDLGPAVRFPPPLLFVAGLGGGVLLDTLLPPSFSATGGTVWEVAGLLCGLVGLAVVYTGITTFRRFRTAVYPNRPAKVLVDSGIYAYTRNPMYLGMTLFYAGGVMLLLSAGALLLLPVVLVLLYTQVIVREERHLRARFPEAYAEYCRKVRRWL